MKKLVLLMLLINSFSVQSMNKSLKDDKDFLGKKEMSASKKK